MKITTNHPTSMHPLAAGETMETIVQNRCGTDPLAVLEYAVTSTPSTLTINFWCASPPPASTWAHGTA